MNAAVAIVHGVPGRTCWLPIVAMALALALLAPERAGAQVIRGVVTERGSEAPLAGALVSLIDARDATASGATIRQAVTNERGEYAIGTPGPGRYRVSARRIGVRAAVSDVITVDASETYRYDITLDPFSSLPLVTVVDRSLCTTGRNQGARVASLWQEARTALNVIVVSSDDSVTQRRLIRYQRVLAPFTFEIRSEAAHSYDAQDGIGESLFRSLSGDSLSLAGYWTDDREAMRFYAPDANALLSTAFVRDHCFGVAEGRGERQGLIGLTFQPVRGRPVAEIRGTLWLDGTSYELRFVEFEWLQLPLELQHDGIGGEVHFTRLPSGRWIVKRWSMKMPRPRIGEIRSVGAAARERLYSDGIGEEGGMVVVQGSVPFDKPATVTGRIVRANGKPLAGARVRLVGTTYRTIADAGGRFGFDSVPPGLYAVVAEHADFDIFGLRAAEHEFVLEEGAQRRLDFQTLGEKDIADSLCPGRDFRLATLRVTLLDENTLRPMRGTALRLRSLKVVQVVRGDLLGQEARDVDIDVTTNESGVAMFCSVAPAQTLTLGFPVDSTGLFPLHTFKLGPQENGIATVKTSPP